MSKERMDITKVLAILAQPKEVLPPLEHVERMKLEISYINKEGKINVRLVRVIMPEEQPKPMPLIYVPHYEMGEDSLELRDYLTKGWAVACPSEFDNCYNGQLTDDDLVFNNAALYTLRHRPEFDKERIILVGGSAGGYMTMMLNGLQLGICASIANGPITNTYFNFYHYFNKANGLNLKAIANMAPDSKDGEKNKDDKENALETMKRVMYVPIPFLAGLYGMFAPIADNFPDKNDVERWEALSAVGIADCFCSPIMVNHCTSDILVPVDQISKRFTYEKVGDSLPGDFDTRLPETFPGKLKYSLEECLPKDDTRTERILVPDKSDEDSVLPYDSEKRFNLNIFDDGPAEGYGTHSSRMDVGRRLDVPYLEEMFAKTSAETNLLTPAMLKSFLLRYQGKSIALPAHTDVDDSVYGSLNIYREEICEELADWKANNGETALYDIFDQVLCEEKDIEHRQMMKMTFEEIRRNIR